MSELQNQAGNLHRRIVARRVRPGPALSKLSTR